MSNTPTSPTTRPERFDHTANPSARGFTGLNWVQGAPMFRMEPAVVETVVTRTTRTTTSFAPLQLPRITPPESLISPTHLSAELYPLATQPLPEDMKVFSINMGNHRVVVQDEPEQVASPHAESSRTGAGRGWARKLPRFDNGATAPVERMSVLQSLDRIQGKEARKRPHQSSAPTPRDRERTPERTPSGHVAGQNRPNVYSPPRKRIRGPDEISIHNDGTGALLSPLPSPESPTPPILSPVAASSLSLGSGHELAMLYSLPSMISHFDGLPDKLQQVVLTQLLRRSRMPTIQRVTAFASTALRRDFISCLPHELAVQVLQSVDTKTLTRASRVNKKWKRMIDTERSIWKQRLIDDDLYHGQGVEEEEEALVTRRFEILDEQARIVPIKADTPEEEDEDDQDEPMSGSHPSRFGQSATPEADRPVPLKHVYRRRHTSNHNWFHKRPMHNSFPGHGTNVVTCLQFDRDKIVSASDDHSINVYATATGQLLKRLDGHEGGVWALQYLGDTLVSGSTDRTLRIWDLETLKQTHVFHGHTSTVRCLQIVEPVYDAESGEYMPPYPVVVTGSRDFTLRVWKLPKKGAPRAKTRWGLNNEGQEVELPHMPEDNPYHQFQLVGHRQAIRALAAYGRYCVSGSYDHTVRVWDIVKGTSLWELKGHDQKVYSIVYDRHRHRCASGSMDNTVKVWDLHTGTCLHTLTGHTSLVGLLGLSPSFLVSAAADSSLRIWNAENAKIKQVLANNGGAITCFQHDEHKVISGSDGMLKLWDIRQGAFVRDLVIGINSVWQVAFNGNLLVAASNRSGHTVFDVFDFGELNHQSGIDNDRLDDLRRPAWERDNPREPRTYQSDEYGHPRQSRLRQGDMSLYASLNSNRPPPRYRSRFAPQQSQQGGTGRRSARLARRPINESSTSPTPVAGPSRIQGTPNRHVASAHHHHHHHHPVALGPGPGPSEYARSNSPAGGTHSSNRQTSLYSGRVTRSRSGPGHHSPSPARFGTNPRTGSTGQIGRLAPGTRRSYAPVFEDDDGVPSPRLRVRDLVDHEYGTGDEDSELSEVETRTRTGTGTGAGIGIGMGIGRRRQYGMDRERRQPQRPLRGHIEEEDDESEEEEEEEEEEEDVMRGIEDDELEADIDGMNVYVGEIDDIE